MSKIIFRTLVAVTVFGVLLAGDADASTRRMTILNGGEGVRSLPQKHAVSTPRTSPRVDIAPLQGIVRGGGRDGFRVAGYAVRLTPQTAVQSIVSRHEDALVQPRVLHGRTVTIYGRPLQSAKIVEANLVIVRPEAHELATRAAKIPLGSDESRYTIPGASAGCGQLRPGAPE